MVIVAIACGALLGTWMLGMPKLAAPDEPGHAIKAYATAHGEMLGLAFEGASPLSRRMLVPGDLSGSACFAFQPEVPAACPQPRPEMARVESNVSVYPPAYYAVVGVAARLTGGQHDLYAYRAYSVLIVVLLLAAAAWRLAGLGRGRPLFLLLGLTPMALFMCMAVNPTSFEISAMLLIWTTVAGWLGAPRPPTRRGFVWIAILGASIVVVRPVSLAWVVLALAAYAVLEERRVAADGRAVARMLAPAAIPFAIAIVASVAWGRFAGLGLADPRFELPGSRGDHLRLAIGHTPELFTEAVGVLGWVDTRLPFVVVALWTAAIVGLLVLAAVAGGRRLRIVALGTATMWILYPIAYTTAGRTPLNWQGRYNVPLLGMLVLAACVLARRRPARVVDSVSRWLACGFVVAEVLAFHQALRRFMVGENGSLLLRGAAWNPPCGGVDAGRAQPRRLRRAGHRAVAVATVRRRRRCDTTVERSVDRSVHTSGADDVETERQGHRDLTRIEGHVVQRSGQAVRGGEVQCVGKAQRLGAHQIAGTVQAALVERHDVVAIPLDAQLVLDVGAQHGLVGQPIDQCERLGQCQGTCARDGLQCGRGDPSPRRFEVQGQDGGGVEVGGHRRGAVGATQPRSSRSSRSSRAPLHTGIGLCGRATSVRRGGINAPAAISGSMPRSVSVSGASTATGRPPTATITRSPDAARLT